jgi:hypothetical protein
MSRGGKTMSIGGEKPKVYLVNCLLNQQKMYFTNKLGGVLGYVYIYTNVDILNWKHHNNFTAMSLK